MDQLQHRPDQRNRNRHVEQRRSQAERQRNRDRPLHSRHVVRAEPLGRDDRKTARQPEEDAHRTEKQRAARAERGKRFDPDRAADDHRIRNIVELLKQIADQQRNRKNQQQPGRRPLRHVLHHKRKTFSILNKTTADEVRSAGGTPPPDGINTADAYNTSFF